MGPFSDTALKSLGEKPPGSKTPSRFVKSSRKNVNEMEIKRFNKWLEENNRKKIDESLLGAVATLGIAAPLAYRAFKRYGKMNKDVKQQVADFKQVKRRNPSRNEVLTMISSAKDKLHADETKWFDDRFRPQKSNRGAGGRFAASTPRGTWRQKIKNIFDRIGQNHPIVTAALQPSMTSAANLIHKHFTRVKQPGPRVVRSPRRRRSTP